ncbi:MAG: hemolysin XhlA family protein [Lachnospira sp.]|nr:hemolysin XhlA family protein [Lachnospira sp.]
MAEGYNAESFEMQVMERLTRIEEKLDGYSDFKKRFYDAEKELALLKDDVQDNKTRINQLESRNQWLARTVVAAVITSLVGVIFCFVKLGMGI